MKSIRAIYRKITQLPPELRVILALFGITSIVALASRFLRGGMKSPHFWWIVGGLVITVLVVVVVRGLISGRLFRREKKFGSELAEQGAGPSRREVAEREAELRTRFKEGLAKLKEANISLYDMPWYLLLGEPGGGKTESLINSGMDFPLGKEELSGFGGTRNYNWWFTNEAVILDTAGRLTFEQEGTTDREEWGQFLRLLQKRRPRCPINGVVVAIPANRLMEDSHDECERKAGILRERLRQIQQVLGVRFPVFVLVTKADLVPGFTEYFDDFDSLQRNQMFGWSRPGPFEVEYSPAGFAADFEALYQRLHDLRLKFLSRRTDEHNLGWTYTFPEAFRALKPRIHSYIETLFSPNRFAEPLFFRGFYFTSALQDGRPILDLLGEHMSNEELDDLKALFPTSRAFFIHDFYVSKVSPEHGMVFRSAKQIRRSRRLRKMTLYAGVPVLLGLIGLVVLGSYLYLSKVRDMREHVEYAQYMINGQVPEDYAGKELEYADRHKDFRAEPKRLVQALYDDVDVIDDRGIIPSIVFPGGAGKLERAILSVTRVLYGTQLLRPLVQKVEGTFEGDYLNQEGSSIQAFHTSLAEYLRWNRRIDSPKLLSLLTVLPKPDGRENYTEEESQFLKFLGEATRGDYYDALARDDRDPKKSERLKTIQAGIRQATAYWMKTAALTPADPDIGRWVELNITSKAAWERYLALLKHSDKLRAEQSPITSIEEYEADFVKGWETILVTANVKGIPTQPTTDVAAQAPLVIPPIFADLQRSIDALNAQWANGVQTLEDVVAARKRRWGAFWDDLYVAAEGRSTVRLVADTPTEAATKPSSTRPVIPDRREKVPDNPVLLAIFTAREELNAAIDKNLLALSNQQKEFHGLIYEIRSVKMESAGGKEVRQLALTEDAGRVQDRIAGLSKQLSVPKGEFDKEYPFITQWSTQLKDLARPVDVKAVTKPLELKQKDAWKEADLVSVAGKLEEVKRKYRRSVFLLSMYQRLNQSLDVPERVEGQEFPPLGVARYMDRAKEKSRRKILDREWPVRYVDAAFVKDAVDQTTQLRKAMEAIPDDSRLAIRREETGDARLKTQDVAQALEDSLTTYLCDDYVGSWAAWYGTYFLNDLYDVQDNQASWEGFLDYLTKERRGVWSRLWDDYVVAGDLLAGSINALLIDPGSDDGSKDRSQTMGEVMTRLFRARTYETLRSSDYCRLLQAVRAGELGGGVSAIAKSAWERCERILQRLKGKQITIEELRNLKELGGMPDILKEVRASVGEGKVFEARLTGQLQYVIAVASALLEAKVNERLLALAKEWKISEGEGYYFPFAKGKVRGDKTLADGQKWLQEIAGVRDALQMTIPGGGQKKDLKEVLSESDARLAFITSAEAWEKFLAVQPGQDKRSYHLAIEFHPLEPGLQNIYRYVVFRLPGLRDKGDKVIGDFQEEIVNIAKSTRQRLDGYWKPAEEPLELGIKETILDTREEFRELIELDGKREKAQKQLDFTLSEISPPKGQFGLLWFLSETGKRLPGDKAVYAREVRFDVEKKSPDLFKKLEATIRAQAVRGFELRIEFLEQPGGIPPTIAVPVFAAVSPPESPMGQVKGKVRPTTTEPARRGRFEF